MKIRRIYFYLSCFLVLPVGLVSALFNRTTLKAMQSHWVKYPYEYNLSVYTPDSFTVLLHQIGWFGIIVVTLVFILSIGLVTYIFKPRYANAINAITLVIAIYCLVASLAWLLIPMSIMARF